MAQEAYPISVLRSAALNMVVTANAALFYPNERFKILVRTSPELVQAGYLNTPYSLKFETLVRTVKNDGALSLWNGFLLTMVRKQVGPPLNTFFQGIVRRWKVASMKKHGFFLWLLNDIPVVSLGAAMSLLIHYPIRLVATIISADSCETSSKRKFSGSLDVVKQTYARYGIRGFYLGYGESIASIAYYRAWYWILYRALNLLPLPGTFTYSFWKGWSISVLCGFLSFPFQVAMDRMIIRAAYSKTPYKGFWEALTTIYRQEGWSALYKDAWYQLAGSVFSGVYYFLRYRSQN